MTREEFMDLVYDELYTDGDNNRANRIIDAADSYAEECKPHWIPVDEGLPEDDTVVLVCGKSGGVYTAIHNNSKTWIYGWWKMNSKNHYCNPTAWMPLPAPPKEIYE